MLIAAFDLLAGVCVCEVVQGISDTVHLREGGNAAPLFSLASCKPTHTFSSRLSGYTGGINARL